MTDVGLPSDSANSPCNSVFTTEILDLHRYLQQWLQGELINDSLGPIRLERALAESFTVVHPTGIREGKVDVIRNFASAYGKKSADYSLDIDDIDIEVMPGGYCFARYKESHGGEPDRARLSCALLRQCHRNNDIEWLFLQETFTAI